MQCAQLFGLIAKTIDAIICRNMLNMAQRIIQQFPSFKFIHPVSVNHHRHIVLSLSHSLYFSGRMP